MMDASCTKTSPRVCIVDGCWGISSSTGCPCIATQSKPKRAEGSPWGAEDHLWTGLLSPLPPRLLVPPRLFLGFAPLSAPPFAPLTSFFPIFPAADRSLCWSTSPLSSPLSGSSPSDGSQPGIKPPALLPDQSPLLGGDAPETRGAAAAEPSLLGSNPPPTARCEDWVNPFAALWPELAPCRRLCNCDESWEFGSCAPGRGPEADNWLSNDTSLDAAPFNADDPRPAPKPQANWSLPSAKELPPKPAEEPTPGLPPPLPLQTPALLLALETPPTLPQPISTTDPAPPPLAQLAPPATWPHSLPLKPVLLCGAFGSPLQREGNFGCWERAEDPKAPNPTSPPNPPTEPSDNPAAACAGGCARTSLPSAPGGIAPSPKAEKLMFTFGKSARKPCCQLSSASGASSLMPPRDDNGELAGGAVLGAARREGSSSGEELKKRAKRELPGRLVSSSSSSSSSTIPFSRSSKLPSIAHGSASLPMGQLPCMTSAAASEEAPGAIDPPPMNPVELILSEQAALKSDAAAISVAATENGGCSEECNRLAGGGTELGATGAKDGEGGEQSQLPLPAAIGRSG
mmetsp:Transcript_32628/g.73688  ORF Transcript_32628/g.73688 Transcript_32628/m.73688 type:complete len:572 (-) Transcript_32628:1259-2974(-)